MATAPITFQNAPLPSCFSRQYSLVLPLNGFSGDYCLLSKPAGFSCARTNCCGGSPVPEQAFHHHKFLLTSSTVRITNACVATPVSGLKWQLPFLYTPSLRPSRRLVLHSFQVHRSSDLTRPCGSFQSSHVPTVWAVPRLAHLTASTLTCLCEEWGIASASLTRTPVRTLLGLRATDRQ